MAIDIDEIFAMYEKVLLHGIPDQAPIYDTIEHTFKAPADEAGGVGDPNTGLSLMWMTERKDGSIDPSKLIVSVNESLNPVVVVESDTAIRVKMVRRIREPQARANVEYFTVDGIDDDEFPHDHPETMRFFDQASAVRMLRLARWCDQGKERRNLHVASHRVGE
jgi:hypothetical protein